MTANLVPAPGVEVPIPTFPAGDNTMFPLVVVLSVKSADVELTVNPPDVTDQVEAAAPVKFKASAEVKASVPEVTVDNVKFPLVFAQLDVPPDIKVMAPVVLPISTVLPPVPAKVVLPETVNPPVPWMSPDPELTPTPTIAPVLDTLN